VIKGVKVKTLKVIPDERGRLMEILRDDDEIFRKFGQVYMTSVYPGVIKGWHYHKVQYDHFTCVAGMMQLVLFDARKKSPTYKEVNEFFIGVHQPLLVQVPPYVYHGFTAAGSKEAIVINISTERYHYQKPDEFRVPTHSKKVPYDWSRKDG